jgi:hypothetical protein
MPRSGQSYYVAAKQRRRTSERKRPSMQGWLHQRALRRNELILLLLEQPSLPIDSRAYIIYHDSELG